VEQKFFLADGHPYDGTVFETENGIRFGEMDVSCPTCGGSGRSFRGICKRCSGNKTIFEQVKLYDEKSLNRLTQNRERRKNKKQAGEIARQEAIDQGHLDCVQANQDLFNRAEKEKGNPFLQDLIEKSQKYGGLTDAQTSAMRRILDGLDIERIRYANSTPIGKVGDELEIMATCIAIHRIRKPNYMRTDMEEIFVHEMLGENGASISFIAKKPMIDVDTNALLKGKVAKIDETRGYPRTMLASVMCSTLDQAPRF